MGSRPSARHQNNRPTSLYNLRRRWVPYHEGDEMPSESQYRRGGGGGAVGSGVLDLENQLDADSGQDSFGGGAHDGGRDVDNNASALGEYVPHDCLSFERRLLGVHKLCVGVRRQFDDVDDRVRLMLPSRCRQQLPRRGRRRPTASSMMPTTNCLVDAVESMTPCVH